MNNSKVIKEGIDKMKDHILMQRENELSLNKNYKAADQQLEECIKKIEALLPEDKRDILQDLDSVQTEWLVAAGDYLYEAGFGDSIKVVKHLLMESFL